MFPSAPYGEELLLGKMVTAATIRVEEELVSTADAREGIIAFLGKRAPKWTGN